MCNLSSVPAWCVLGLLPITLFQRILHLASLMARLHLTCIFIISCTPFVAKAIFMYKMMFYELIDRHWEEPVIWSQLIGAIPIPIPLPSWFHLKKIYILAWDIYAFRENLSIFLNASIACRGKMNRWGRVGTLMVIPIKACLILANS